MFFGDYKAHAVPFFISSSLLPLDLLYFKSVAVLMYDVSNNTSPPQISNLFNYQHNIHSHNTRSSTRGNFFLEYSRLDKLNMSFSRNGVRVWNNLSNEIRQMPKVKFKRNIHNMLLQKLPEANEYIDLLDLNIPCKMNFQLSFNVWEFLEISGNLQLFSKIKFQLFSRNIFLDFASFKFFQKLEIAGKTCPYQKLTAFSSFFLFPENWENCNFNTYGQEYT